MKSALSETAWSIEGRPGLARLATVLTALALLLVLVPR